MKKTLLKIAFCTAFGIFMLSANSQNTWLQKASLTALNGREYATGFSIGHYGYIGLGETSSGWADDFWRWDQHNNTWTTIANYPGEGRDGVTSFTINGKGYSCLGWSGSANCSDLWEYDTTSNTWTQMASFPGNARYGAFVFVIGAKAYVGCGEPDGPPYYQDMWMYNSVTNTWTQEPNFPGGVRTGACGFAINGFGYVGLGWDYTNVYNDLWKYDTTAHTWASVSPLPISGGLTCSVNFVLDTLAYVGTGLNESTGKYDRDFWCFSATTDTWSHIATLTGVGRWTAVGFAIGDMGYIGIGQDSASDFLQDYWEYTPTVLAGVPSFTKLSGNISVYPNPNNGSFTIQSSGISGQSLVEIYNMLGEKVYSNYQITKSSNYQINLSSRPNGVYLYRVITENGSLVGQGKLVIQK